MQTKKLSLWAILCALAVFPVMAHAGTLYVNCNAHKGLTQIQKAVNLLQQAESTGSKTILVSGRCKENITIKSLDNLTLTAQNGASITDPSNGTLDVIDVLDSRRVDIQGFSINGGANGVLCAKYSLCRFSGNTIQGSSGAGVAVSSSQAGLSGDTLQNHVVRGLSAVNGSQVNAVSIVVQGNGAGIIVGVNSTLILGDSTVQGNFGVGIRAVGGSVIRVLASTVTANGGNGVELDRSAHASFEGFEGTNGITNNGSAGVYLGYLSFALFDVNSNVTGNGAGTDVVCGGRFNATQGALTNIGGTSNCVEP